MNRPDGTVVLVAFAVVLAALPVVVAGGMSPSAAGAGATDAGAASQTSDAERTPPGARLAGVVGVQRAEIEGELTQRTFDQRLGAARSNASKAGVVAEQVDSARERLTELRERKAELQAARRNGSLSEGEYRARMAELAARIAAVKHLADSTSVAAKDLPDQALAQQGVNVAALDDLRNSAAELGGGEVAAIAKEVAGPNVGTPVGGPPSNAGNAGNGAPDGTPGNGDGAPGQGERTNNGDGDDTGNGDGTPGAGGNSAGDGASGNGNGTGNDGAGSGDY